jgi:hypothetical protein
MYLQYNNNMIIKKIRRINHFPLDSISWTKVRDAEHKWKKSTSSFHTLSKILHRRFHELLSAASLIPSETIQWENEWTYF